MGKKIIMMLSFLMTGVAMLLSSDIVSSQIIYSELDNTALTVGYYISKSGTITDSIKQYVKKETGAKIYCGMEECKSVKKGETYIYILEKEYIPVVLQSDIRSIKIKRSVVVGLYSWIT